MRTLICLAVISMFSIEAVGCSSCRSRDREREAAHGDVSATRATPRQCRLRVAVIGDSGVDDNAAAVLRLIKREQADMVVHQGDLGYDHPAGWVDMVDSILGEAFPYLFSIGNHDGGDDDDDNRGAWRRVYEPFLARKLQTVDGLQCTRPSEQSPRDGAGSRMACRYRGVLLALLDFRGPPNHPEQQAGLQFLARQLSADRSLWQICSWHLPDPRMSLGDDIRHIGLQPYTTCMASGAIVLTAHEHQYSRTKTFTRLEPEPAIDTRSDEHTARVRPGATFAVVSGLGGNGIDPVRCDTGAGNDCGIWARSYDDDYGALFLDFDCQGQPQRARGYFKTVAGETIDTFEIISERSGTKPADAKPADARPADARPADAKPADAKPADQRPTTGDHTVSSSF